MLVCGRNVARDLLKSNKKVEKAYLQDGFQDEEIISLLEKAKIDIDYRSKSEIDGFDLGVHQGIILSIPDYHYYSLDSLNENDEVILILDHIEDPHNFGAIIRTCEAAGIQSIIISQDRQVPVNATVMKTSAGTLESVHIIRVSNIANSIEQLKKKGYWIVGTSLQDNSVDYRKIDYSGKIALIVGNEGNGISNLVMKKCDYIAKIPMYGLTNSLNVSVATGIMIYEMIRNRK